MSTVMISHALKECLERLKRVIFIAPLSNHLLRDCKPIVAFDGPVDLVRLVVANKVALTLVAILDLFELLQCNFCSIVRQCST